ncbi:MAG: efflux RND transporter periplasmic adaptor subunit [Myxococcales bacterium]|nr:efflux RND transporter periplasmic adaptor subunit [Myxococcales bacterium]
MRLLVSFVVSLLLPWGCASPGPGPGAAAYEAAYSLDGAGRMQVRADLWPRLGLATVEVSDVEAELVGVGRLEFAPDAAYAVRVPFAAYVEAVHVTAGASVRRGDALARLRSAEVARLRSEVRRLDATIAARRDAVDRYRRLVKDGASSPRELVQSQADLAESEAELRGVREGLRAVRADRAGADEFVLRASADGQVLLRTLDPGERVSPDDEEPAFLIGDAGRLVAMAAFAERDAAALRDGGACSFTVPALGAVTHAGTLMQVVQTLDRATRTASAVCVPTGVDPRLRAEMAARVRAVVRGAGATVVPRAAVLLRRDEFVAFVAVGEGLLERRRVALGPGFGGRVVVVEGLAAGERVVVADSVLLDGELDALL